MRKLKPLLNFVQLAVAEKIAFYRNVIARLTANPTYPNPDVTLADALAAVNALEAAYLATKDGSHTAVSAMHDAEDKADALFKLLAAYVNRIADGNETDILTSGFHASKQNASVQKPELSVQDGDISGNVWLVARAVEKAGAYIWQAAKDNIPTTDEGWTTIGHSTQSYFQVKELPIASKYYFRMSAITNTGNTDFTAPVMRVIS